MIIENDSLVTDDKKLATIFNDYYINIIETSTILAKNYGQNCEKRRCR